MICRIITYTKFNKKIQHKSEFQVNFFVIKMLEKKGMQTFFIDQINFLNFLEVWHNALSIGLNIIYNQYTI